jgi:hypothetical protein
MASGAPRPTTTASRRESPQSCGPSSPDLPVMLRRPSTIPTVRPVPHKRPSVEITCRAAAASVAAEAGAAGAATPWLAGCPDPMRSARSSCCLAADSMLSAQSPHPGRRTRVDRLRRLPHPSSGAVRGLRRRAAARAPLLIVRHPPHDAAPRRSVRAEHGVNQQRSLRPGRSLPQPPAALLEASVSEAEPAAPTRVTKGISRGPKIGPLSCGADTSAELLADNSADLCADLFADA